MLCYRIHLLECGKWCTTLGREQQNETVHQFVAECICTVIWRDNHLDFLLCIAKERFKYNTAFTRKCTRWLGHYWAEYAFDRKWIAAEHAQYDADVGRIVVIWIVGLMLRQSNAFDQIVENVVDVILMLWLAVMVEIQRCIDECAVEPLRDTQII